MRSVYSWRLTKSDPQPVGKKPCKSLREQEAEIQKDKYDGIDTFLSKKVTLNDRFDLYMKNKLNLKESTAMNYRYMYDRYVRDTLGRLNLADINTS